MKELIYLTLGLLILGPTRQCENYPHLGLYSTECENYQNLWGSNARPISSDLALYLSKIFITQCVAQIPIFS